MSRFSEENFNSIQRIFEMRTGVCLHKKRHSSAFMVNRAALIATVVILSVLLLAFTYPLFSPLNGDALTLKAEYVGKGTVLIEVQNLSDRDLEFEPQVKLFQWITGEEIPQHSQDILYDGLSVPANTTGTLKIDLSNAYDIEQLESSLVTEWHYLLLTNQNFIYGQNWKCSVFFGTPLPSIETVTPKYAIDPAIIGQVEEELRFYFEDDFTGILAANPMHYEYLQTAQELLMRSGKNIVPLFDGGLIAVPNTDEVILGETEREYPPQNITVQDAFGKLVGATTDEHIKYICYYAPESAEDNGSSFMIPLVYYATFEKDVLCGVDDCAFVHGQMVSFEELAPYQVYEDDMYVCYNVTHLFYSELKTYVDDIIEYRIATQQDYYMDEEVYAEIQAHYDYYMHNMKLVTWEEFVALRNSCTIREQPDSEELVTNGLSGQIVSDVDILEVTITIASNTRQVLYTQTIVPESTDSPWAAYGYELSEAEEVSETIKGLPPGEYIISVDVLVDSDINARRGLWEMVFTVEET